MIFSKTVKESINIKCWCTMPIPKSFATVGFLILTFFPRTKIEPAVGVIKPDKILIKVDLPAPFSPKRAKISPFLKVKLISLLALKPLKSFTIWRISITFVISFILCKFPFSKKTLCINLHKEF